MTRDWVITVMPAYGRDYETAEGAIADWLADKDFFICTPGYPSYLNKADAERFGTPRNTIRIRYKKKTELVILKYDPVKKSWTSEGSTEDDEEES